MWMPRTSATEKSFYPLPCLGVRPVFFSASGGVCDAGRYIYRVRVFLLVLGVVAQALRGLHQSRAFEIASNDGYLLQYFVRSGIEV